MLADLHLGDTVGVYSLSRLSRGMKHLVELGERFEAEGIGLVSLTEAIDTSTTHGEIRVRHGRSAQRWSATCSPSSPWSSASMRSCSRLAGSE